MAGTKLTPEKITSPMQLMAAWFSMLVLLITVLLTAASNISSPSWAAGYLVIFASLVVLAVLGCVTLMLTKFRPRLQEGREYAQWLKDRNLYTQATVTVSTSAVPRQTRSGRKALAPKEQIEAKAKPMIAQKAFLINISHYDGAEQIAAALRNEGFVPDIYYGFGDDDREPQGLSHHASIWVGANVPAGSAIQAIKVALKTWPHLKYMQLSNDGADPPEEVHHELYIGGATSTAKEAGLVPWTMPELLALKDGMSQAEFHKAIRAKY